MGNSDDNPSGESHPTPPLQPAPAPAAGEVGDTLEVQRKKGLRRDIVCTLESQRIIKEVHVLSGQCGHCVRHAASEAEHLANQTQAIREKGAMGFSKLLFAIRIHFWRPGQPCELPAKS